MANREKISEKMEQKFHERLAETLYSNNTKAKRALGFERSRRKLTNKDIYHAYAYNWNTIDQDD
jgi:hypothetical protein